MIKAQDYIQEITTALAILAHKVEINASLNLTDINLGAENFYRDLLNLSLGLQLKNINTIDPNAKAIDLGDTKNKLAIQVTSTSSFKKTKETVQGFIEGKRYEQYDRLYILNLVKKAKHKQLYVGTKGVFQLNTKDHIWDYKDFARQIIDKDIVTLKEISEFLNTQLKILPEDKPAKEVATFLAMIELLSDDTHPLAGKGFIEEPDPEGKIEKRFASHADYLKAAYIDDFEVYGNVLKTVLDGSDLGTVRVRKIGLYLKRYSDHVLSDCQGNPKLALEIMTSEFATKLAKQGVEYDESAVSFYLIDHLIRCNVFPNLEAVSA